jgi:hypothetical protein
MFLAEATALGEKGTSYRYGDLRRFPLGDNWFDEIISISTLEHIGMNAALIEVVR